MAIEDPVLDYLLAVFRGAKEGEPLSPEVLKAHLEAMERVERARGLEAAEETIAKLERRCEDLRRRVELLEERFPKRR